MNNKNTHRLYKHDSNPRSRRDLVYDFIDEPHGVKVVVCVPSKDGRSWVVIQEDLYQNKNIARDIWRELKSEGFIQTSKTYDAYTTRDYWRKYQYCLRDAEVSSNLDLWGKSVI